MRELCYLPAQNVVTFLLEVTFPFPLLIAASSYVDKYGREERYNIVGIADKVSCPCLFTYGQLEIEHGGIAFAGVPEALAPLSPEFTIVRLVFYSTFFNLRNGPEVSRKSSVCVTLERSNFSRNFQLSFFIPGSDRANRRHLPTAKPRTPSE